MTTISITEKDLHFLMGVMEIGMNVIINDATNIPINPICVVNNPAPLFLVV